VQKISRAFLAAACALASVAATAQTYPSKPVHIVTLFVPGSTGDLTARIIAGAMSKSFGQPVVVDNLAGGGGVTAGEKVVRSAPDGYTLFYSVSGLHVSRIYLARSTPFDPVNDFTPITTVSESVTVLVSHASVPVGSFKDLLDYAKANPGKLSYGSAGVGSAHHLAGALVSQLTGIDWVHVPYKAAFSSVQDILSGQIPTVFAQAGTLMSAARAGKVKILAIMGGQRYEGLPDVPTIGEVLPGYEPPPGWSGMLAPPNLPRPILMRLHGEILAALQTKESRDGQAKNVSATVTSPTPEAFLAKMRREVELVGRIVKRANIQPLD
jgi:tripartite-type tricarboxylate transporter receptor subunit TctC